MTAVAPVTDTASHARAVAYAAFSSAVVYPDAEVLEFVAETPGSIGYVSPEAQVPEGVKALQVLP